MTNPISVGWYDETDAAIADASLGFTGLDVDQANTVLKHLDATIGMRLLRSAFMSPHLILSDDASPYSFVSLGGGAVAWHDVTSNTFRKWHPSTGITSPSWGTLAPNGGVIRGELIADDEVIFWSGSTTNSVVSAVHVVVSTDTVTTLTNGTDPDKKGWHSFVKVGSYYYRVANLGNLEYNNGVFADFAWPLLLSGCVVTCPFRTRASVANGSAGYMIAGSFTTSDFKIIEGATIVQSGTLTDITLANVIAIRECNHRLLAVKPNTVTRSEIDLPFTHESSHATPGIGWGTNLTTNVRCHGSVVVINGSTDTVISPDTGVTWSTTYAPHKMSGGRLFNKRSMSLSI